MKKVSSGLEGLEGTKYKVLGHIMNLGFGSYLNYKNLCKILSIMLINNISFLQ